VVGARLDNRSGGERCDTGEIAHLTIVHTSCIATSTERWQASNVADVVEYLGEETVVWWLAGGAALDLFLGRSSRSHADLDIGVPRRDINEILRRLQGWDVREASGGTLVPLEGGRLPRRHVNSLWCRRRGATHWSFELLLDEVLGDTWVYRRDARITRPMCDAVMRSIQDVPFLAPEIQLLYKSKDTRDRDRIDFGNVIPHLDASASHWLRDALQLTAPSHEWLALLDGQH
jgi:hypothetical protein